MQIREAREADVPQICELGARSLREGPYARHLTANPKQAELLAREVVRRPSARVFVAVEKERVVGLLAFIVFPHYFSGERTAGELMWYVEPEWRAGGTAIDLLRAAEAEARKLGATHMQLTAPTASVGKLYCRCGYEEVETTFQRKL